MARPKRENAERVVVVFDSDLLVEAKVRAIKKKLNFSQYIESLAKKDLGKPPEITVNLELFDEKPATKKKAPLKRANANN